MPTGAWSTSPSRGDALQKSYCIICGKQREGIAVEDDFVLAAIRWFKTNITHNERNNRLVVCKECYPKYAESRRKFESRERLYVAFGVIFAALNLLISRSLSSIAISIVIVLLLLAFSFLSYTPKISIKKQHSQ